MNEISVQSKPRMTFGTNPAPLMYMAKYEQGSWGERGIISLSDLTLSPLAMCFHYGQTVFEGLKAFRSPENQVSIFRHRDNFDRINISLERMGMPKLLSEVWDEGILSLLAQVKSYVPSSEEGALYIRPFVIATQPKLGVEISDEYLFLVVVCPTSFYYNKNLRVKVERHFTRASPGGVGFAKCGGNYGNSLYPFQKAKEEGFDQILWTDAEDHEYLEESGTMNFGFIIDGTFITPPVSDTILDGITRKSLIQLANDAQIPVSERAFTVTELREAFLNKKKVEAFGIGTAAVLAPFKFISIDGVEFPCYYEKDALMYWLKSQLMGIQTGQIKDIYSWNTLIN